MGIFVNWGKISLFLSGLFFGGAIDHVILAIMNDPLTPYGLKLGVIGNWGLAALDLVLAALLYAWHQSSDSARKIKR